MPQAMLALWSVTSWSVVTVGEKGSDRCSSRRSVKRPRRRAGPCSRGRPLTRRRLVVASPERLGAEVARINRTSVLVLADVDWQMVQEWADAKRARERGYRIEMIDGVFPAHLRADAARFHHIMQTAPRDDLDIGDVILDANDIAGLDRALLEAGRSRWTAFVRDADGACVGGTEVTFEPWEPTTALQQNTGIDPSHRRLGLAKWVKATMVERVRHDRPDVQRIRTDNAFSNAPMLVINESLGFKVMSTRTEWQADVSEVSRTLNR